MVILENTNDMKGGRYRMRRLLIVTFTCAILAACGTADQDGDNANNDLPDEPDINEEEIDEEEEDMFGDDEEDESNDQEDDQAYMKEKMDELDFYEIEVEVEYENNLEYEAEIERDDDHYEAELEDDLNNIDIRGLEAFEEIYPLAEALDLSSDSSDEEAIDEVLEVFDLPDDYEEIEIEIDFHDGSELDIEQRK